MDHVSDECRSEAAELLAGLVKEWTPDETKELSHNLKLREVETIPALFQPREIAEKHISDLRKVLKRNLEVDPVTVLRVGQRSILIDGHHRLEAYRLEKRKTLPVVWFRGTPEEATLEAGMMNSKAKLPMSSAERQNYAWRMVLIGIHSKADIAEASGVSSSQVATMRKVRKDLGTAAFDYPTWWKARRASQGNPEDMSVEDRDQWKQEQADRWADRLAKTFSSKMSRNPEIAAMAFNTYFGGKLGEVFRELREFVGESELDDGVSDF